MSVRRALLFSIIVLFILAFPLYLWAIGLRPIYYGMKKWYNLSLRHSESKQTHFEYEKRNYILRSVAVLPGQMTLDMWGNVGNSYENTFAAVSVESIDGTVIIPLNGDAGSFLNVSEIRHTKSNLFSIRGGDGGGSYSGILRIELNKNEVGGGNIQVVSVEDPACMLFLRYTK